MAFKACSAPAVRAPVPGVRRALWTPADTFSLSGDLRTPLAPPRVATSEGPAQSLIALRAREATAPKEARYQAWRMDINGVEYRIDGKDFATESEAQKYCEDMEARGHHQTYFVVSPGRRGDVSGVTGR